MRVKTTKLAVSLVLMLALLPLLNACADNTGSVESGSLVVNEIISSNKRSLVDETLGTPDWIELYNAGSSEIDLSGYGVSDNVRKLHKYVFPEGTTLGAGEYLVLYATTLEEGMDAGSAVCTNFGLSKSGDYVFVTDAFYGIVAQIELPALYTDVSYARASDGTYGFCAVPTPGAANSDSIFDSLSEVFAAQNLNALTISEVMPSDDESGYRWVELHNNGDSAIQLENYCLSDDEADPLKWQFTSGTVAPGGYVCIYLSGLGSEAKDGIHTTFKLSKEDTVLLLSDLQGNAIDRMEWQALLPEGISALKNEAGETVYTAFPTFEAANSDQTFATTSMSVMDDSDPVHINEVLKYNTLSIADSDGERYEWVELKNFSSSPVTLKGYFLSDDPDDLYKWALPDITLEAGAYQVVFLSGKNTTSGELHASFSLSDEENDVLLTTLNGMRSEDLSLAGITRENVSVGLDDDRNIRYYAAPTPGAENAHGFETADQIGCFDNQGVFISEVSAIQTVKSSENDWIELYNGSSKEVDLTGWTLSDDPDEPTKFTLQGVSIAAGGYRVIECTSHTTRQTAEIAPFGISPSGETIVLYNASGVLVDSFSTGALSPGITSGRIISDPYTARVFFQTETKGEENDAGVSVGLSPQPVFSETGLYQTEPFSVTITCSDPNAAIYYTTDGDEPSASSTLYTGPVTVSGSMPLRAVSIVQGKLVSDIATSTYLFVEPHTIPVVCITGNPDRINEVMRVDDKDEKVERLAYISYYEADGELGITFPAGIKPKGAGTIVYGQKSLSLNLRAGYGQSSVTYPFWDDYEFKTFSALALRNGGQDWSVARIRDSYISRLVEGMYLDNSATRPVVVYINGEYNGLYDLNEDLNAEYLVTHYGIDGDTVDFIRRNEAVIKGTNKDIRRVRSIGSNSDLSDDENFAEYSQWVDVTYFTDYYIATTYICNSDMFNQKYWRTQDYTLKWRPVFFDLDFGFKSATRDMLSKFFNPKGEASPDQSRTYFEIYIGLRKNAAWRDYCVERYVEVVETYFNSERATALLDEMASALRPEMPRQIEKWNRPYSMEDWEEAIAELRDIVANRPEYALANLQDYFNVSQEKMDELIAKYSK
ncbi:MAG: lamin tail domain-containing protein [Clostridiaceae bacterium]